MWCISTATRAVFETAFPSFYIVCVCVFVIADGDKACFMLDAPHAH